VTTEKYTLFGISSVLVSTMYIIYKKTPFRKYAGYGLTPFGNKKVEVNEVHQPGFHGGYKVSQIPNC
jgi:uncharacterized membrane protein YccF (DUF307 family)